MVFKALPSTLKLVLFISRLLLKLHKNHTKALKRTLSATGHQHLHPQSPTFPLHLSSTTLIFDVEGTLLRSSSMFPYFMLVAFEAGSFVRAFLLLALYPLVWLVGEDASLSIMVMVSFFGIKKEGFRVGSSVLPKFFLEDVGEEGFNVLMRRPAGDQKKLVGVSRLPRVMVESFLRDYMEIDHVLGRELVVFGGYFVGLMKQNINTMNMIHDDLLLLLEPDHAVCFFNNSIKHKHDMSWISCTKEVSKGEKAGWKVVGRERYPKALTFHDGRLAFRPEPQRMLAMFIWFPFALCLSLFRTLIALSLPYAALIPILAFTGLRLKLNHAPAQYHHHDDDDDQSRGGGRLYACNHRTLLDPLYLSFGLKRPIAAVTYSLSRMSELLSPIKTVRLTRDREEDARTMERMLRQGDLVVCPEGTTCREPYLLRFSPLFAELSDRIVPVALDSEVSMFYGTTAGGMKWLDPFMFMMNPGPGYRVWFLEEVGGGKGTSSRVEVANDVQREIGKTLGFECTTLTRKHKYLVLAGNDGLLHS